MGLAHIAAHEFPIRYAKSQIRVVAVFFIRRVLLTAIGAKLVLRSPLNSSPPHYWCLLVVFWP